MRVLFITHGYPPFGVAGVERVTEQAALGLTAAGHSVTVLARRAAGAPALPRIEYESRDGVTVVWLSGPATSGGFPAGQERVERIFERVLLEAMPDVVVLSHLITQSPAYAAIAHRWDVPVVVELHDFYLVCERAHLQRPSGDLCDGPEGGRACAKYCFRDDPQGLPRWALRTHMFREALSLADAVLAPSAFVADYFRRESRPVAPITVIPNGVAFEESGSAHAGRSGERGLHLASLGAVVSHKGPHLVVEALRQARLEAVRYTLFGPAMQPYAGRVREAATRVEGVEFRAYGAYEPDLLPALLADVDAVIIPSLVWETFSVVAREALACGVPVIAARSGALSEAVRDGENGILFDPASISQLAVILQDLDRDPALLARLRSGISSDDWISVSERTMRLERVLKTTVESGVDALAGTGSPELAAMRSLLRT